MAAVDATSMTGAAGRTGLQSGQRFQSNNLDDTLLAQGITVVAALRPRCGLRALTAPARTAEQALA
ncbi:MAG: hypothetical protein HYU37_05525 [Acidobacteria bacterium]|nr:hypothetical protein [Acidobacteriota bacterium]